MVSVVNANSNCHNKTESSIKQLEKFKSEQGQLFKHELTEEERKDFESQLKELPEPSVLKEMFQKAMEADCKLKESKDSKLKPVDDELIMISNRGSEKWSEWHKIGMEALKNGECSIVTLAGGQGTRLGSSAPKGCYKIGLPSGASLFQIQAERVLKIEKLANTKAPLSWYIMTSAPTHKATVDFFEENKYFGLKKDQVKFFQQGVLPAFDMEGKILMTSRGKISVAPDGNGGIYKALEREGILDDMKKKGIKFVHMYCVDNCLVKVGDPAFIGACIESGTDCAAKCVKKTEPSESVGVFCKNSNDKLVVAEYSELDAETAQAVDSKTGRLLFGEANIANHFFTVNFLGKLTEGLNLPYHIARKKIPTFDPITGENGTTAGVKLEAFIFDVFERAEKPMLFRVPRLEEFAPLKNAPGAPKDSPEYCTDLLFSLHRKYLQEAGAKVDEKGKVELSASLTYEGEGLESFNGKEIKNAAALVYRLVMASLKRDRLWDSFKKEFKYLETQTELLVSGMSALATARQTLALVSKKFIPTDRVEHDIFTHTNNCKNILKQMNSTFLTVEREIRAFKATTEKDNLICEAVDKSVNEILDSCKVHISSCSEAFEALCNDPLVSETTAKSLLSLVIHRPVLFGVHKSQIADIEILLVIK